MKKLKQDIEDRILELYFNGTMPNNVKNGILYTVNESYKAKDKKYLVLTKKLLNDSEFTSQTIESHKQIIQGHPVLNDYFK